MRSETKPEQPFGGSMGACRAVNGVPARTGRCLRQRQLTTLGAERGESTVNLPKMTGRSRPSESAVTRAQTVWVNPASFAAALPSTSALTFPPQPVARIGSCELSSEAVDDGKVRQAATHATRFKGCTNGRLNHHP